MRILYICAEGDHPRSHSFKAYLSKSLEHSKDTIIIELRVRNKAKVREVVSFFYITGLKIEDFYLSLYHIKFK